MEAVITQPLWALGYLGGKSPTHPTNPWIRSLLPDDKDVTYVEPYAGMLGVLLNRPPARSELANDLNARVVNWWEVVRDDIDEFERKVLHTPYSESLFRESKAGLDEGTPMERAVRFFSVVHTSVMHGDGSVANFGIVWDHDRSSGFSKTMVSSLRAVSQRVQGVGFTTGCAIDLLEGIADRPDVVAYCDPPYHSAYTEGYAVGNVDYARVLDVLRSVKGRVAISGYGTEWDELGWERHELQTTCTVGANHTRGSAAQRTEVLWANYPQPQGLLL